MVLEFQKGEVTEYHIYKALARRTKSDNNRDVLSRIAEEELRHYDIWKNYTGMEIKPDKLKIGFYVMLSALFGVTFCIKLMEGGESRAQDAYERLSRDVPEAAEIQKEEFEHENQLVRMIDEERLAYIGSMVLGLNDALVEFTGALAGFTFALQSSRLIAITGMIMGISASLSMAASEYLSTKTEAEGKSPLKAAFYTGTAYVITVVVLVFPFFFFSNHFLSLGVTLLLAVLLILVFNFYYSVVKELPFKARFLEMLAISMGVAGLSFLIGMIVRNGLGVAH